MARSSNASRPGRALLFLVAILAVVYAVVGIRTVTSNGGWTPALALDLEGGTEIILEPTPLNGENVTPTSEQLDEAVNVIRQRVNGSGVSEAEITTQSGKNIVVSLPGDPDEATLNLVKQSAQMNFRPVLVSEAVTTTATSTATPTPSTTSSADATPKASTSAKASAKATEKAEQGDSSDDADENKRVVPKALRADATPTDEATSSPSAASTAESSAAASADPSATSSATASSDDTTATTDASTGTASDLSQITEELYAQYTAETCSDPAKIQSNAVAADKPLVTCDQDGLYKYILGPVEVPGSDISDATAGLQANSQGFSTGAWVVNLEFNSDGSKKFGEVTSRLIQLTGSQNQFAIVLDQLVVSAPTTNSAITNGQAEISGSFTQDSAELLAQQLKFGSLPVSFQVQTQNQISALLGGEQLERGLLAGLIGLVLVVIYSLLQYRALGLVTVFSLGIAGALTYGLVVLLGETEGYRLSLAGVTGLIVAIGITADSFIVYFERVRDEVREGRPLTSAVEAGWDRAKRTILASDAVNFIAAIVLYLVAVGGVRGFAFTLGLTTLIDVVIVFLFTKPAVTMLSRMHFFSGGHALSGFSPAQLGRPSAYAGRGRVRPSGPTGEGESIAARRAAAAREAGLEPGDPGGGSADQDHVTTSGPGRNS
ncbi:protein translocase subunit SecD [Kineosporia sp. J2-2]|uniref:Protein translocase subunit SecD n=1 Tax=Kineosporia corallincola TaxID=2835133 RepID=A0ABS5TD10_9ACTN|nr:protein translocase subunit SecD [Kineosporia corallincola]MBT0768975.1 protein translocase subunit SecD [Kineosporia corallincola]